MTSPSETIAKAMEGGYWSASVYDCRPPHSKRDNPRKHSRTMSLPGTFSTEQEALAAGADAIQKGWAGNNIVHRESASHSATFQLSRAAVSDIARAIPDLLALALQVEAMEREMAELREVRAGGRDAAATLHDALMVERAENAELRAMLERCAPAEQSKSLLPIPSWQDARTLIQGEKK